MKVHLTYRPALKRELLVHTYTTHTKRSGAVSMYQISCACGYMYKCVCVWLCMCVVVYVRAFVFSPFHTCVKQNPPLNLFVNGQVDGGLSAVS